MAGAEKGAFVLKTCNVCGRFFMALMKLQKYCVVCRGKKKYYTVKGEHPAQCETCGKKFMTRQAARFCSDPCRLKANYVKRTHKAVCQVCGAEYESSKAYQKFCSVACRLDAKKERDNARRHKTTTD